MKSSLLLAGLLLFAASARAQHGHQHQMSGNSSGFGNNVGSWGSGGEWGSSTLGYAGRAVSYEDPRSFSLEYERNDGPFVPSTFMSYEQAVALGQQQLAATEKAAQGESTASLGEVARSYRAVKVPTLRLQVRVLQDNAGNITVCNLNGNDCHRPRRFDAN
jgi:hypothetical protein